MTETKPNELFGSNNTVVFNMDALTGLGKLSSTTVDVVVTSPPYWGQRDYTCGDELGKESTSKDYITSMHEIGNEIRRVLKDSGVYFLNIGDKYRKKGLEMIPERLAFKMCESGWMVRNKIIWHKTNPNPCPVTDRFTNAYEVIFMFVKDTNNYLPPEYYFDLDPVRVEHKSKESNGKNGHLPKTIDVSEYEKYTNLIKNTTYEGKFKGQESINIGASAGGRVGTNGEYYSLQRKANITPALKIEIIEFLRKARKDKGLSIPEIDEMMGTTYSAGHWFRVDRGGRALPSPEHWEHLKRILDLQDTKYDKIMTEYHYVLQTVRHHEKGKNPSDVWPMATSNIKEKHFAPFPEKLPEMCIKSCCPIDGVVLDPFVGAGTTLKVASRLKRYSIGIEINHTYLDIIKRVVGDDITIIPPPPNNLHFYFPIVGMEYFVSFVRLFDQSECLATIAVSN